MFLDFSSALPTFVITLREGVEAALVIGIVLAYLKKAKQTQLNHWVLGGGLCGVVASALVGVLFTGLIEWVSQLNPQYATVVEPLLEGGFSLVAIALLSWMLLWMTQQAKFLKTQVEGAVSALTQSTQAGWGIFGLIFFAVLREGFETVLFIAAKFQQGLIPALGAIAGLAASGVIGLLLFRWGIRINIKRFFQVMGVLLLLIVAGLVVTALGHFDAAMNTLSSMSRQSEALCFYREHFVKDPACILGPMVWNASKVLPDDRFPGIILSALFGYTQKLYFIQAVAYGVFLITVGGVYFQSLAGRVLLPLKVLVRSRS